MQYTPRDILNYVYEKELDTQFLLATANHVQDFSIGEITDKKIEKRGEDFYLVSKSYHLDITTLIISKKPGNTGISRDIRTEFTTDLLLSD